MNEKTLRNKKKMNSSAVSLVRYSIPFLHLRDVIDGLYVQRKQRGRILASNGDSISVTI